MNIVFLGFFFFWSLSSLSRLFHSYGDVNINSWWRAALCSALMAIEQWGFLSVPHLLWHGHPFIILISEDSHLLPIVWQWICHLLRSNLTKVRPLFTLSHRGYDNSPLLIVFMWTLYELCLCIYYVMISTNQIAYLKQCSIFEDDEIV